MSKSQKGSNFERDLCKLLSLWWSEGKRDDLLWRTAGSGARATTRRKKGKQTTNATGDIMSTDPSTKPLLKVCCFELKRGFSTKYKIVKNKKTRKKGVKIVSHGLEILTIIDKQDYHKDPVLLQWWRKIEKERKAAKRKFSLLIFRRDQKVACIVMSYNTFNFLTKRNGVFDNRILSFHFSLAENLSSLVILKLDDFLNWCKPKCFLNMPRQIKRR